MTRCTNLVWVSWYAGDARQSKVEWFQREASLIHESDEEATETGIYMDGDVIALTKLKQYNREINSLAPGRCYFNPLRATFFRENINIYLHFVSYLHIDTTQVVEILPHVIQEPAYAT